MLAHALHMSAGRADTAADELSALPVSATKLQICSRFAQERLLYCGCARQFMRRTLGLRVAAFNVVAYNVLFALAVTDSRSVTEPLLSDRLFVCRGSPPSRLSDHMMALRPFLKQPAPSTIELGSEIAF